MELTQNERAVLLFGSTEEYEDLTSRVGFATVSLLDLSPKVENISEKSFSKELGIFLCARRLSKQDTFVLGGFEGIAIVSLQTQQLLLNRVVNLRQMEVVFDLEMRGDKEVVYTAFSGERYSINKVRIEN